MPKALEIGISEREFWSLNPHKINIRINVYNSLQKQKDEDMWHLGMYIHRAVLSAIDKCLGGKLEYFDKPMYEQAKEENKELTEDEKLQQVKALFTSLEIMQGNFERNHKNGGD